MSVLNNLVQSERFTFCETQGGAVCVIYRQALSRSFLRISRVLHNYSISSEMATASCWPHAVHCCEVLSRGSKGTRSIHRGMPFLLSLLAPVMHSLLLWLHNAHSPPIPGRKVWRCTYVWVCILVNLLAWPKGMWAWMSTVPRAL